MILLAIETSCDETSIALVEASGGLRAPKFTVLKNIISSQIAVHIPFGGVVPNLAKREHLKNLPKVLRQILNFQFPISPPGADPPSEDNFQKRKNQKSKLVASGYTPNPSSIDAIAVTVGPGLEPALWAGIEFAKELYKKWNATSDKRQVKLLGANHMEGHLYSNWLTNSDKRQATSKKRKIEFPAVALVVSGGHTILLYMQSMTKWKKLGETRDDAAGEAFDKVARMLGLPYPGGPQIAKLAKKGDCNAINFPQPMRNHQNYDFSFSGVKTAVLYYIRDKVKATGKKLTQKEKTDIAASFERAVTDVLAYKTARAAREFGAKTILLSGGVAANQLLRKKLKKVAENFGIAFAAPEMEYNTDNAAMIAAAAYIRVLQKKKYRLIAQSNLSL
jgi:N6-L-threonylcarbamoyladenine synthase